MVIDADKVKQQQSKEKNSHQVKAQCNIKENFGGKQIGKDEQDDGNLAKSECCDVELDLVVSILQTVIVAFDDPFYSFQSYD